MPRRATLVLVTALWLAVFLPALTFGQSTSGAPAPSNPPVQNVTADQLATPNNSTQGRDDQTILQDGYSQARIVRLSYVEGDVRIDRGGGEGFTKAFANMPLVEGAR